MILNRIALVLNHNKKPPDGCPSGGLRRKRILFLTTSEQIRWHLHGALSRTSFIYIYYFTLSCVCQYDPSHLIPIPLMAFYGWFFGKTRGRFGRPGSMGIFHPPEPTTSNSRKRSLTFPSRHPFLPTLATNVGRDAYFIPWRFPPTPSPLPPNRITHRCSGIPGSANGNKPPLPNFPSRLLFPPLQLLLFLSSLPWLSLLIGMRIK